MRAPLAHLALTLTLAGVAASGAQAQDKPGTPALAKLTIGTVLPLSGPQAAYGKEAQRGFDLALDELKLKDPELAARVLVVPGDDQSTSREAAAAAEKLLEKERAHVLIGSVASASTLAVAGVAHKQQIPVVAPLATQTGFITGGGVFRGCMSEALEGALLAEFALNVLGVKQAATLREDGLGTQPFVERFKEAFKAGGGTLTAEETYDLAAEDFTPQLKKIQASGAKLIVTPAPYHVAGPLFQQAKKLAPDWRFLGTDSWDTPALNKAAGGAAAGNFFVTHFAADDTDAAVVDFVKAFQLKYGRAPGTIAALAYDNLNLTVDAFKRARTNLKGPLSAALDKTRDFAGVTGLFTYEGLGGDPAKGAVVKETTADGAKFKARVVPRGPSAVAVDPKTPQPVKGH